MTSIAEWAAKLDKATEDATGLVVSSQPGSPAALAPGARLLWLKQALSELGVDSGFLSDADALASRASALRQEAVQASQQAAQRRAAALNTLGRDRTATLAEAVAQWTAQSPWLDTQPGELRTPALELADRAAKIIEGEVAVKIIGHSPRLWSLAQKKAAEVVQEVADLPAMPPQLWEVSKPAQEFARWREHQRSYGTLLACYHKFELCHAIGNLVRDHLGYGYPQFPSGAPRTAMWLKNWRKELADDGHFARQSAPLKLRYALDAGFGPGLWAPSDVEDSTPEDRSFGGRLKNLGHAVHAGFSGT
jgi:hypothetical protein